MPALILSRRLRHGLVLLLACMLLTACEKEQEAAPAPPVASPTDDTASSPSAAKPMPPVFENFEGEPQLSLFPRIGNVRPEITEEGYPFWLSYIDHVVRTSGVVPAPGTGSQRSWALRAIGNLDSIGFFAPLAVEPSTRYRISARLTTDLAAGASAGIGIIEFREFLWIGEQFTAAQMEQYTLRSTEGGRLSGTNNWQELSFVLETTPKTRMIHLVLFREGAKDRHPVLFDDISIAPLAATGN